LRKDQFITELGITTRTKDIMKKTHKYNDEKKITENLNCAEAEDTLVAAVDTSAAA